jgi:NDP-sugar pyrophosphorylase family protein
MDINSSINEQAEKTSGVRAVILAGGKGHRLKPFTINFPKPLMPLDDLPIVEHLIRRLIVFGITDITLSLGHMAELFKAYFYHRPSLTRQIELKYVEEEEPLGTAGSLAIIDGLDKTFLAMNGDLLTNLDFQKLLEFHREQQAMLTIATSHREVKIDLGVLEFDDNYQVINYLEKPEKIFDVSMGIYVYEPQVLEYIEHGRYLDFPDLVLRLIEQGKSVCAYRTDCLWLDIGNPADYAQAQELLNSEKDIFQS